MPIIPRVGRKSIKVRLTFLAMYTALTIGAVAMVYPFLLMLSTSVTSSTDTNEFRVVPRYLLSDDALFAKFIDDKYAGDLETINRLYHTRFQSIAFARIASLSQTQSFDHQKWDSFVNQLPSGFKATGFRGYGLHPGRLDSLYRSHVRELFHNDIHSLNSAYTEENETFQTVRPPVERPNKRLGSADNSRKAQDFDNWKTKLSSNLNMVVSVQEIWARFLAEEVQQYGGKPDLAASVWGAVKSFDKIPLPPTVPADPLQRRDWNLFIRTKLPFRYLDIGSQGIHFYQMSLWRKYHQIARLNLIYGTAYQDFTEVPLPGSIPDAGPISKDYVAFVRKSLPMRCVIIDSPELRFSKFLGQHIGLDTNIANASLPLYAADSTYVRNHPSELRRGYVTSNYALIAEYLLLHGHSLVVTVVYCLLAVGVTLIVNPLCAYALSQFNLSYSYRVLMLLLATMAFPAEVAMIPNFLLLKQLGMLNTYWALVLPGAASGYSIFLLKGFFDSLPKDIFESGRMDGASDVRMYFKIALPLSRPIFAVIALYAFVGAYGAFMFAMLVCQNSKMWTVMVWLYELQEKNPQYVMMAGAVVAAIPTLAVFGLAQNVIMKGIVLPTDK